MNITYITDTWSKRMRLFTLLHKTFPYSQVIKRNSPEGRLGLDWYINSASLCALFLAFHERDWYYYMDVSTHNPQLKIR